MREPLEVLPVHSVIPVSLRSMGQWMPCPLADRNPRAETVKAALFRWGAAAGQILTSCYAKVAMNEMALGDLHLASTGRTVPVMGQSATKTADLRGMAELFSVRSHAWK